MRGAQEPVALHGAQDQKIRAKLGKPTGGAAPFGYRWHEKRLVPNPEEAPIRRLMYERSRLPQPSPPPSHPEGTYPWPNHSRIEKPAQLRSALSKVQVVTAPNACARAPIR